MRVALNQLVCLAGVAAMVFSVGACDIPFPFADMEWATPSLDVRDSQLEGNFGELAVAEETAARATGFEGYGVEWVEVMVVRDEGTSMALVAFEDGLDAFPVGTRQTFRNLGGDLSDITVLGCAGDEPFVWYADEDAVEVTLAVDDHPMEAGLRRYTFDATFEDNSHLSGFFDAAP
ncbi:MAG: hypothetical protein ACI9MR_003911 [Myxococcota bacterium]|jgi:hypothetical protein